jgi:hypothetical protein
MTCLTDTFCSNGGLLELIFTATAAIDYAGTVFFGHDWQPISPEVAAQAEMIGEYFADFFARPVGGCQRYASLGGLHG